VSKRGKEEVEEAQGCGRAGARESERERERANERASQTKRETEKKREREGGSKAAGLTARRGAGSAGRQRKTSVSREGGSRDTRPPALASGMRALLPVKRMRKALLPGGGHYFP